MEKVNALTFVGKSHFEFDVVCNNEILHTKDSPITPDIILKLCFKELYTGIEQTLPEIPPEIEVPPQPKEKESIKSQYEKIDLVFNKKAEAEQKSKPLVFNEKDAEEFSAKCITVAKLMKFPKEALDGLEKAAYYLESGRAGFSEEDAKEPDFCSKVIEASIKKVEAMGFSRTISEGIRNSRKIYAPDFVLDKDCPIPYSHIISMVISYCKLMEKYNDKAVCIDILRKKGVQYFDVFVLHKFINYMRTSDL